MNIDLPGLEKRVEALEKERTAQDARLKALEERVTAAGKALTTSPGQEG